MKPLEPQEALLIEKVGPYPIYMTANWNIASHAV